MMRLFSLLSCHSRESGNPVQRSKLDSRFRGNDIVVALGLLLFATPAAAQIRVDITGGISQPMPIAIPAMPTPAATGTAAGDTASLGKRVAEVISNDLKNSGLFTPLGPNALAPVAYQ